MFLKYKLRLAINKIISDIHDIRGIIIAILIYGALTQFFFGTVCPFKIITGIDCPGCGLTRGCLCVLIGQWKRALEYNPMSFAWVLLIIFLLLQRYLLNMKKIFWEVPAFIVSITTIILWIQRVIINIIIR
jgi:hypothetical protein